MFLETGVCLRQFFNTLDRAFGIYLVKIERNVGFISFPVKLEKSMGLICCFL